jgi:hypothetical protein
MYILKRRLNGMSAARLILNRMIDELPDDMVTEIITYISFAQKTKKELIFKELEETSVSSIDFWNNSIDDEVWNDV